MDTANTEALDRADMARLAAGGDAALNDLMERHAPRVFHFLYRMLGQEDDAHDLAQETFVRVYQHRSSFKLDARFTTWLYTIAGNLARNHLRWRSRHPNVPLDAPPSDSAPGLGELLPAPGSSPDEAAQREERLAAVRTAVGQLPDDLREAIVLCEWEDFSVAEAATVLEPTPKALESRLYRARNLLRGKLGKWL
jgi:RNA polymerase sigma-70 factor, ECF subfamily